METTVHLSNIRKKYIPTIKFMGPLISSILNNNKSKIFGQLEMGIDDDFV